MCLLLPKNGIGGGVNKRLDQKDPIAKIPGLGESRREKSVLKYLVIFFCTAALMIGFAKTIEPRMEPLQMKVSVIIPCAGKHFELLPNLLDLYRQQTCLPDEVVISLSSIETLKAEEIDALENSPWPFKVSILRAEGKQSPGLNRNIAVSHATGDVIISQDADDLPHPQRVEIIKYMFENYAVDHLLHKWIAEGEAITPYEKNHVPIHGFDRYDDIGRTALGDRMHNGNNACSRAVVDRIHWVDVKKLDSDQDVKFNRDVYDAFEHTAVIPCELIVYRWRLSVLLQNQKND